MNVPDFSCEYVDGEDPSTEAADGDVTRFRVALLDGGKVCIRRHGLRDAVPFDQTIEASIVGFFKDQGLVKLDVDSLYFDLRKKRLVSSVEPTVLARRSAPGDRFQPARVQAGMSFLLRLAAVLGWEGPHQTPLFPGWPPPEFDPAGSVSRLNLTVVGGRALCVTRRHELAGTPGDLDELRIDLDDRTPWVGLHVSSSGVCTFLVRAPLELHHAAEAMAARFDWS
jgi:hypothetical protein